jgi:hypothetical protein
MIDDLSIDRIIGSSTHWFIIDAFVQYRAIAFIDPMTLIR